MAVRGPEDFVEVRKRQIVSADVDERSGRSSH
jgi:hypothetical protein